MMQTKSKTQAKDTKNGKSSRVFFEFSGRFGRALNVHVERGKKIKKGRGSKASLPEKGDALQQVVRFPLRGLGQ